MHQGLDLSKFRKVAADNRAVTLRHVKGHEIKIAHAATSPAMRDALKAMPIHLSEGGEADEPDEPEKAAHYEIPGLGAEKPAWQEEDTTAEEPSPAVGEEQTDGTDAGEESEDDAEAEPQTPDATGGKSTADAVIGQRPAITPSAPPTKDELDNEDALFAEDLARGHIKPETLQSLYGKQDTIGKIGTLFGILVSGMGSGLTGQPNAVLEMMNNVVKNDLEAQQHSNANAQNWLRLSQNHEYQKAQIKQIESQIGLTGAQKTQAMAHVENLKADTEIKAVSAAEKRIRLDLLKRMTGIVDRQPDGPMKERASETLNTVVAPAIAAQNAQTNTNTAGQLQLRDAVRNPLPNGIQLSPRVNTAVISKMIQQARMTEGIAGPGMSAIAPEQGDKMMTEAALVNGNRMAFDVWKDGFQKLDRSFAAGKLNPENRNAIIAPIKAALIRGHMGSDDAQKLLDGIIPSEKDYLGARDEKLQKGMEHFMGVEAGGTPWLSSKPGLIPAFPAPPTLLKNETKRGGSAPKAETHKDGESATSKSGKPMIWRDGRWNYVK